MIGFETVPTILSAKMPWTARMPSFRLKIVKIELAEALK